MKLVHITSNAMHQALGKPPRECGKCSLCCKVKSIVELDKDQNVWCRYAKPGCGCGIYETRPASCRDWSCQWLLDMSIPDEHRPDKAGFVIETHADRNRLLISADPKRPLNTRLVSEYVRRAHAAGMTVVAITQGFSLVLAPPGKSQELELALWNSDIRMMEEHAETKYKA